MDESGSSKITPPLPRQMSGSGRNGSSPSLQRRKSQGKERADGGKRERPAFLKEIGSATISLRAAAVQDLSDDDGEEVLISKTGSASGMRRGSGGKGDAAGRTPSGSGKSRTGWSGIMQEMQGYSLGVPLDDKSPASQTSTLPSPLEQPPGFRRYGSGVRAPLPTITSPIVSPPAQSAFFKRSNTANRLPPVAGTVRRTRSNSVHVPGRVGDGTGSYFLPHYSTDRAYSRPETSALETDSGGASQINLELGLGGAFDASFGEALRRGVGGEEMPLPQEALRVLTEAKESLETRLMGKQGRKGSMGMGLFKESRKALGKKAEERGTLLKRATKSEHGTPPIAPTNETVVPPLSIPAPSVPTPRKRGYTKAEADMNQPPPLAPPVATSLEEANDSGDAASIAASIRILAASPVLSRRSRASLINPADLPNMVLPDTDYRSAHRGSISMSDDSGYTSGTASSLSPSGSEDEEDSDPAPSQSEEDGYFSQRPHSQDIHSDDTEMSAEEVEEDRMTVPLQPFNHAVGGHSSIYKFTRRAVCKVSNTKSSADFSLWSAERISSTRRSSGLLLLYSPLSLDTSASCSSTIENTVFPPTMMAPAPPPIPTPQL